MSVSVPWPPRRFSRRAFLRRGIFGVGALSWAGAQEAPAGTGAASSRFAYPLERWRQTDPKLIHHRLASRFRCPRAETHRIAIGPEGRVYLAAGNFIGVLNREGAVEFEAAFAGPPRCLAVAGDGTLYAGMRDHVEVCDARGQVRAKWDAPPGRPFFTGLAAGANDVFAADAGNRVVVRYDRSGKLVQRIGGKNPARGIPGFVVPSPHFDVEMAPDGLLRVNNPGRHRVEAYTVGGDFEFAWGKPSAAVSGFCGCCNPTGLAMLADGRCVTCEKGLPRVKIYGAEGAFESVVAGPESFAENVRASAGEDSTRGGLDIAVDAQGRVYILDLVTCDVRIMAPKEGA